VSTFGRGLFYAVFLTLKALMARVVLGVNALVMDEAGRVLLVRHGYQPGWQLPGGGVDGGETPDMAIRRELEEEIGLSGGVIRPCGQYTRRVLWMHQLVLLYRAEGAAIAFQPSLEIREILWVDPAAPPAGLSAGTRRRLAELQGAPVSDIW